MILLATTYNNKHVNYERRRFLGGNGRRPFLDIFGLRTTSTQRHQALKCR